MKIPNNLRLRLLIALSSMLVYAFIFPILYPHVGLTVAALNMIPAVTFGWFLGVRGSLMYGVLLVPVNVFLFHWVGIVQENELFSHMVGVSGFTLASLGIGWIRGLNQRIKKQAEELQEEIERRVQAETALRQSNTELQARNKELEAFAHTVAHDLKNPLGMITSYGEILSGDGLTMSPEQLDLIFKEIQKSGRKAANIIEELLLLASLRKEAVKLRPLNMAQIVEGAQHRISLMIQEYQSEIICPQNWPQAQGYAPWVEEIWVNYLSNGLKYGGKPPCLELGGTLQENDMIRFWVRDNGPGLPPEAQLLLFAEFTRLDEIRTEGHGLGLSIVRRIVEKFGGQVGVESDHVPGRGCTFYFTLPAVAGMHFDRLIQGKNLLPDFRLG